eukprot:COSAG05_NODE_1114_length_5840_cov_2.676886_5_plen_109_part_00
MQGVAADCGGWVEAGQSGVFSAAIMAGFLGATAAGSTSRAEIVAQLQWLYTHGVCLYAKTLPATGEVVKVLWRCSVNQPQWRATIADSAHLLRVDCCFVCVLPLSLLI